MRRALLFNVSAAFISFSFAIFSALLIWLNTSKLPLVIPLWFSKPWGKDWLAAPVFLWFIPSVSFLIILVNSFLAANFWHRERLLSFLLVASSCVTSGLLFYSLLEIILVVS